MTSPLNQTPLMPSHELAPDLRDYRQPTVTAIGIILAFLIGFLADWATDTGFGLEASDDLITFAGCMAGALLLLAALFRMLAIPKTGDVETHYRRTLGLLAGGVTCALMGILGAGFM